MMVTKVGAEFRPDASMKTIYMIYLVLALLFGFAPWLVPVIIYVLWFDPVYTLFLGLFLAPFLALLFFVVYWINRFYESVTYRLTEREVIVTQGVWFRTKRFVPYDRITNVEINQGPVSRRYGVGKVAIQTAGYSGASSSGGRAAEAEIKFIKNFEEMKDTVISFLGKTRPVAIEAGGDDSDELDTDRQILDELKKIRRVLEKPRSVKRSD